MKKNQAEQCHTVLIQVQSWHEGQTANKIKPLKWLVRGAGDGSANWRRKTNLCFRVQSLPPRKGEWPRPGGSEEKHSLNALKRLRPFKWFSDGTPVANRPSVALGDENKLVSRGKVHFCEGLSI